MSQFWIWSSALSTLASSSPRLTSAPSAAFSGRNGAYGPYIAFTLQMWRQGYRKNSPDAMAVIAKKLGEQEIAALAAYYQQMQSALEATEAQGRS